jgi:hypothetical protein
VNFGQIIATHAKHDRADGEVPEIESRDQFPKVLGERNRELLLSMFDRNCWRRSLDESEPDKHGFQRQILPVQACQMSLTDSSFIAIVLGPSDCRAADTAIACSLVPPTLNDGEQNNDPTNYSDSP